MVVVAYYIDSLSFINTIFASHQCILGVPKDLLANDGGIETSRCSLLFCAPEAVIGCEKWRELLVGSQLHERIVCIAVDEAHCVSKW